MAPDDPKPTAAAALLERAPARSSGQVLSFASALMGGPQPTNLKQGDALRVVRALAGDTDNIVVMPYGERKSKKRKISRRQIELCVQEGTLAEGPFVNSQGDWQMNLFRHAAGEQVTCVVAIDWASKVLVINVF